MKRRDIDANTLSLGLLTDGWTNILTFLCVPFLYPHDTGIADLTYLYVMRFVSKDMYEMVNNHVEKNFLHAHPIEYDNEPFAWFSGFDYSDYYFRAISSAPSLVLWLHAEICPLTCAVLGKFKSIMIWEAAGHSGNIAVLDLLNKELENNVVSIINGAVHGNQIHVIDWALSQQYTNTTKLMSSFVVAHLIQACKSNNLAIIRRFITAIIKNSNRNHHYVGVEYKIITHIPGHCAHVSDLYETEPLFYAAIEAGSLEILKFFKEIGLLLRDTNYQFKCVDIKNQILSRKITEQSLTMWIEKELAQKD